MPVCAQCGDEIPVPEKAITFRVAVEGQGEHESISTTYQVLCCAPVCAFALVRLILGGNY